MVEAMRVSFTFSMNSSRDCCCFLLKYWISSRYSTTPSGARRVPTSAVMALMSAREAVVALSRWKGRPIRAAAISATVVLPVPEGP